MTSRLDALTQWLQRELGQAPAIAPASADASFRRYFRIAHAGRTLIVMDAPPDKEQTGPFLHIARLLRGAGLNAPEILAADTEQGFLLLTDLGQTHYLGALTGANVQQLYGDALHALFVMQTRLRAEAAGLPLYDAAVLAREMELFREWYLIQHRGLSLSAAQHAALDAVFERLISMALAQPRVFVHRDYHSRNLMLTPEDNPGILDFQDALYGPVTYDLVSLLRDCYIAWPRAQVEAWALDYLQRLQQVGVIPARTDARTLLQWFDWMGVQRHLKAAGIFARLNHRDHKPGYLADIPRTLGYVREVSSRYAELEPLAGLLAEVGAGEGNASAAAS
jgi:aminoglycoside/choline kinase family phosphotransferase